jgi:hypothetical protein
VMHRSDRRYCSDSHRVLAARARKRERQAALASEQQARVPAELTSRPRWVRHKDKVPLRTAGDGIVVIDLDHAVEAGELRPWAERIVDSLPPTYMERGRSGTGLHLWFRGAVPAGRRIRRGELAFEVYSDRRYIIVGDRVPGTPLELAVLPDAAGLVASLT